MIVYCATSNPGKLREFNQIAEHHGGARLSVLPLPGLPGIPAPEETGSTFVENAKIKAEYYAQFTSEPVFADDSGLAVDALNGAPGIYSARFAGDGATDAANNERLLDLMRGKTVRTARFVCAIAIVRRGGVPEVFEDFVEGELLTVRRGANGFGYDPLFYFPPFAHTFGEATPEAKLLVSHRGKAMEKMIYWILNHYK